MRATQKKLYSALKELVRCVRGGDETAGVSMDDALIDADEAIALVDLDTEFAGLPSITQTIEDGRAARRRR